MASLQYNAEKYSLTTEYNIIWSQLYGNQAALDVYDRTGNKTQTTTGGFLRRI